jgi:hypothetical protein
MSKGNDNWKNLSEKLEERVKDDLNWTWTTVAQRSGLSDGHLRRIRRGTNPVLRPDTVERLESTLGWQPGSVRACLAGGEPTPVEAALLPSMDSASVDLGTQAEVDAELVQRWASMLNQPFTATALKQLIDDFAWVRARALAERQSDHSNE